MKTFSFIRHSITQFSILSYFMFLITGDRILSLTIDFRHVVQEDAMTILSYASPYNIQLELVDGKGVIGTTSSPKSGRSTLQHPLYRSSSQTDVSTVSFVRK